MAVELLVHPLAHVLETVGQPDLWHLRRLRKVSNVRVMFVNHYLRKVTILVEELQTSPFLLPIGGDQGARFWSVRAAAKSEHFAAGREERGCTRAVCTTHTLST